MKEQQAKRQSNNNKKYGFWHINEIRVWMCMTGPGLSPAVNSLYTCRWIGGHAPLLCLPKNNTENTPKNRRRRKNQQQFAHTFESHTRITTTAPILYVSEAEKKTMRPRARVHKKQLYKRIFRSSRLVAARLFALLCLFAFSFRLDIRHIFVGRVFSVYSLEDHAIAINFYAALLFIVFSSYFIRFDHFNRTDANTFETNAFCAGNQTRWKVATNHAFSARGFVYFVYIFCWWHNFNYCICLSDCSVVWLLSRGFHESWFNFMNVSVFFCWRRWWWCCCCLC